MEKKTEMPVAQKPNFTFDGLAELQARNAERARKFAESMGSRWVLHPDNSPKKMDYQPILQGRKHPGGV